MAATTSNKLLENFGLGFLYVTTAQLKWEIRIFVFNLENLIKFKITVAVF